MSYIFALLRALKRLYAFQQSLRTTAASPFVCRSSCPSCLRGEVLICAIVVNLRISFLSRTSGEKQHEKYTVLASHNSLLQVNARKCRTKTT